MSVGRAAVEASPDLVSKVQATIEEARCLGLEADRALAALRSGGPGDVEGVLLATRKADAAFRMLDAARNAMFEAYAQVRDIR